MKTVFFIFFNGPFRSQCLFSVDRRKSLAVRRPKKSRCKLTLRALPMLVANKSEDIRKNYQKELADLKSKYDKELKKMNGGAKKSKNVAPALPPIKEVKEAHARRPTPLPVKGIAKELPAKAADSEEATPIQGVSEGTKVVTVTSEPPDSGLEKEASESDQVEVIEMPTE